MCEYNPCEAVKTNIEGTNNVIDACLRGNVEKLIFTSTGKAVKPTTVYGASKLLAERLLALANTKHQIRERYLRVSDLETYWALVVLFSLFLKGK